MVKCESPAGGRASLSLYLMLTGVSIDCCGYRRVHHQSRDGRLSLHAIGIDPGNPISLARAIETDEGSRIRDLSAYQTALQPIFGI